MASGREAPITHPLVAQLRFTRHEFIRGVRGVGDDEARLRLGTMNCISWNVGHLAWQEQRYFLGVEGKEIPFPDIQRDFSYGAPASTPRLDYVVEAWTAITSAADPFLDTLTSADLLASPPGDGRPTKRTRGNLLQRMIYHYWYHNGENQAIRQQLGHTGLPEYVGDIDSMAPFTAE